MLSVIKALYGVEGSFIDVKNVVSKHISNSVLKLPVSNDILTDPKVGQVKKLYLTLLHDGKEVEYIAYEGENLIYPKEKYAAANTLVLTSCNRIDQILLAIAVNKEIIKEDFNLVVVDCSTPEKSIEDGIRMHQSDDPYNLIKQHNYNPNWKEIENYVKTIRKIKNFRIVHMTPRMGKQVGEATMVSVGLNVAAMMGSKYFLKLTGVCHLKYDFFETFKDKIKEAAIYTWYRTGYGDQKSTRVFAGRPDELNIALLKAGMPEWIVEYDFIERKLGRIIDTYLPNENVNPNIDERDIIVDEGIGRNDHRQILTQNLEKHNLLNSNDPIIKKFLNGEIW